MPSANMKRIPLDLYPENVEALEKVITESEVPRTRFIRELLIIALNNSNEVAEAVKASRTTLYRQAE